MGLFLDENAIAQLQIICGLVSTSKQVRQQVALKQAATVSFHTIRISLQLSFETRICIQF
jgi:hypothetical protein